MQDDSDRALNFDLGGSRHRPSALVRRTSPEGPGRSCQAAIESIKMSEIPELQYYKIAISRNGGPIAMILREKTFFFGKKDDTKNFIFIFSSYGKLIQTVNVSKSFYLTFLFSFAKRYPT